MEHRPPASLSKARLRQIGETSPTPGRGMGQTTRAGHLTTTGAEYVERGPAKGELPTPYSATRHVMLAGHLMSNSKNEW